MIVYFSGLIVMVVDLMEFGEKDVWIIEIGVVVSVLIILIFVYWNLVIMLVLLVIIGVLVVIV